MNKMNGFLAPDLTGEEAETQSVLQGFKSGCIHLIVKAGVVSLFFFFPHVSIFVLIFKPRLKSVLMSSSVINLNVSNLVSYSFPQAEGETAEINSSKTC